jgi:hypothetical protein
MWDHNLVIWDENFFRTWVDVRASTNAQLDEFAVSTKVGTTNEGYSYDLTRSNFPRGFRVLVIDNVQVMLHILHQVLQVEISLDSLIKLLNGMEGHGKLNTVLMLIRIL